MATMNPFDLLGDDAEDPVQQLIAAEQQKVAALPKKVTALTQRKPEATAQQTNKPASLPSKPLPPSQAVREAKSGNSRGGGRGGGRGSGRGFGRGRAVTGFNRETPNDENFFSNSGIPSGHAFEDGESQKLAERRGGYGGSQDGYRSGRRGGFNNGEAVEEGRPRRTFERHSGTGRGNEFKREGAGRGNWGTQTDEVAHVTEEVKHETEKNMGDEKPSTEEAGADGNKENSANESEEKEPEDKEMTLEEYEKVLAEKRQALEALKIEERKVDAKEFESMQQLSSKKGNVDVFIKLSSEKDKRKDVLEKEEKTKKSVSINEFLKPAEGERFYSSVGRGRGRGRASRGSFGGHGHMNSNAAAPSIEDPGQFPTLGGK